MSRDGTLVLALIHDVFCEPDGAARLVERLGEARADGVDLAVLPELPLDPWVPGLERPRAEDAERSHGPRHQALAAAAGGVGIGVLGGAITIDEASGERRNRALLFDAQGDDVAIYDKLHVPYEEGFWEAAHYMAGTEPPSVAEGFPLRIGVQVCSDLFRPTGCLLLGALGAEVILAPRATPATSYARWRAMISANAVASAAYVVSVNRPAVEFGVPIGGPSLVAAPDGGVIHESTAPVSIVRLERDVVAGARQGYPGYLAVRSDVYERGWSRVQPSPGRR